jgi:hypothetical protein
MCLHVLWLGEMTALVMIAQHFVEIYKSKNPTCSDTGLERYRKIVNLIYGKSYAPPIYMTDGQPKSSKPVHDHSSLESNHQSGLPLSTNSLANGQPAVSHANSHAPRRRPGWILPADLPPENRPPDPLRFSTAISRFTPETLSWRFNNEFYAVPPVFLSYFSNSFLSISQSDHLLLYNTKIIKYV